MIAKLTMMQDSRVGPIFPRGVCVENVLALAVEHQLAIVFSPPCKFNTIVFLFTMDAANHTMEPIKPTTHKINSLLLDKQSWFATFSFDLKLDHERHRGIGTHRQIA